MGRKTTNSGGVRFVDDDRNNILLGQGHGHPSTSKKGYNNESGTSKEDAALAKAYQIPIYAIDSYTGENTANIARVLPNGKPASTVGNVGVQNYKIAVDALKIKTGIKKN